MIVGHASSMLLELPISAVYWTLFEPNIPSSFSDSFTFSTGVVSESTGFLSGAAVPGIELDAGLEGTFGGVVLLPLGSNTT